LGFSQYHESGTWEVEYVSAWDNVGNYGAYSTAQLASLGFPTQVQVVNPPPDLTGPTLESLSIAPATVNVSTGQSATVAVTARWKDAQSGFMNGLMRKRSPSGVRRIDAGIYDYHRISGDNKDGLYRFELGFSQYHESGTWVVDYIVGYDNMSNGGGYSTSQLASRGYPTQVQVTTPSPDLYGPTLQSLSISPATVDVSNGPQVVTVTMRWIDQESGFMNGIMYVRSPSGAQRNDVAIYDTSRISGDSRDGVYRPQLGFSPYHESGIWVIEAIVAYDNMINGRGYSAVDLQRMGFPGCMDRADR